MSVRWSLARLCLIFRSGPSCEILSKKEEPTPNNRLASPFVFEASSSPRQVPAIIRIATVASGFWTSIVPSELVHNRTRQRSSNSPWPSTIRASSYLINRSHGKILAYKMEYKRICWTLPCCVHNFLQYGPI
ncbi:uncharacterized protein LOC114577732 [Apis cerana]|uniref:uncharacterized protein LOC114577732 n=1 Tax=Apis cerana TaxID=7461 RepID=UPI002B22EC86|nr:uncharacterized protein LOC114577732 [Apis cerana]